MYLERQLFKKSFNATAMRFVSLWFVGAFWEEEKESRADFMMRIFCRISSWTNIFVTLLYLIFVKKTYYLLNMFIFNKLHLSVCW